MISLQQLQLAINEKILATFPSLEIQSKDIREGFNRPTFFVEFEPSIVSAYGARGRERRIEITIYYFPTDPNEYRMELLEVQEKLEASFLRSFPIVEGFYVYPSDLETVMTDGTLQTRFELYLLEVDATEDGEDIEVLQLNIEKRE